MRKPWAAAVAIAIVAAIGLGLHASRRHPATADDAAPAATDTGATVAAKAVVEAPQIAPALSPTAAPAAAPPGDLWLPSHDLRDFLDAAQAGDTDAMLRVGRSLHSCIRYLADPDGKKIDEEYEREMTRAREFAARNKGDASHLFRNAETRFAIQRATHADCMAIGAERIRTGLHWTELAARAGRAEAKLQYARDAFSEFENENALLANLDDLARRRDLARQWAMEALEAGERGAIEVISRGYYGDSALFPRDLQQGAPYSMAQEILTARFRSQEEFQRLYDQGPPRERYAWGNENAWVRDDAAWQAALERARAIVDLMPPDPPR